MTRQELEKRKQAIYKIEQALEMAKDAISIFEETAPIEISWDLGKTVPDSGWFKSNVNSKFLMFFKDGVCQYGINGKEVWKQEPHDKYKLTDNHVPANPEDVGMTLIDFAKDMGFRSGTHHQWTNQIRKNTDHFRWDGECIINMWSDGADNDGYVIYRNGKWMKVIIDALTINDEIVEIGESYIKIGCNEQSIDTFINAIASLKHWGIDSINHPDIGEISVKELAEIREKL